MKLYELHPTTIQNIFTTYSLVAPKGGKYVHV